MTTNFKLSDHYEMLLKLQQQRAYEEFCDVRLKIGETIFPAHKALLAAATDYFFKMFTIEMREQNSQVIEIEGVTTRAMEQVLDSIYTGQVKLAEQSIGEILHAASMMQLTSLLHLTRDHMLASLNPSNCCLFLELATLYSFDELIEKVNNFFLKKFDEVSLQESFLSFDVDTIEQILLSDELTVEEEVNVFNFVVNWINWSPEERKIMFPQLFCHVRLQFIPVKEVINIIGKHDLVRKFPECWDIILDAISFHNDPNVFTIQSHRKCFAPISDSVMVLSNTRQSQAVYNFETGQWKMLKYDDLTNKEIICQDSAVATNYPVTVLCGGITKSEKVTKQVIKFDGIRWIKMPTMHVARCGAAAVICHEKIYVFGGETKPIPNKATFRVVQGNPATESFANTFETFDKEWIVENLPVEVAACGSYWRAQACNDMIYLNWRIPSSTGT